MESGCLTHCFIHTLGSAMKSVFLFWCRESLSEIIITDLGNYRHKRVLGLAAMFGDQLVTSKFVILTVTIHS